VLRRDVAVVVVVVWAVEGGGGEWVGEGFAAVARVLGPEPELDGIAWDVVAAAAAVLLLPPPPLVLPSTLI
jgi:hypothetical protein